MTLVFGLDVGTQGTKGIAIDAEARVVVARAARGYGLIEGLPVGAAEQHPDTWITAIREVLAELESKTSGQQPVALGVSGQQHGLVVLDAKGAVVRPAKLWCDTETAPEAAELSQKLGHPLPTGFTASKVLWLARHEPEHWARTAHVLLPHEYVNYRLTGRFTSEAGDASGTGWFDPQMRRCDLAAMTAIDKRLAGLVPELIQPCSPAGTVSPEAARTFGLPDGMLISAGGGDNMLSAIGSGCVRTGIVTVSVGTSGTVFAHTDKPVVDPEGLIAPFCSSSGGWLPLLCVMNMTGVLEEVVTAFASDHESLTEAARDVPLGCDGLTFIPYLAGERVPDLPHATGVLEGLRAGHLRPGTLYRAALEGTCHNLAWGVDRMRALDVAVSRVRLVGGAARNSLLREILADSLDAPVELVAETESAALGAALQALWCLRRQRDAEADLESISAPFVNTAIEPDRPDAGRARRYADLQQHFRQRVTHHYPDPAG